MSVFVDLEKRLKGDFHLKVAFEAENEILALLGAPYDPDLAVGFICGIGRRLSVFGQIRLCQHILKLKPLYPR